MSKIENIVFDIGNVLMEWDPEGIYKALFNKNDYYDHPLSSIVGGEIWLKMDRGTLDMDQAIEQLSMANKPYGKEIDIFIREAPHYIEPLTDSVAGAMEYKKRGYRIFLLSNFPEYGFKIINSKFNFFNSFHGGVISWEVNAIKPDKKIYEILLSKYSLDPGETIFIDDVKANIKTAEDLGIKGLHFIDGMDLCMELAGIIEN